MHAIKLEQLKKITILAAAKRCPDESELPAAGAWPCPVCLCPGDRNNPSWLFPRVSTPPCHQSWVTQDGLATLCLRHRLFWAVPIALGWVGRRVDFCSAPGRALAAVNSTLVLKQRLMCQEVGFLGAGISGCWDFWVLGRLKTKIAIPG